ncbi:MAG: cyclase family protein [Eubacteriales bacterium]|nr:cyclase family protein [Eubacteriales bacterium]
MNRKVIDLTHAMVNQMDVFPGDPPVGILTHHNYKNGYFVSQVIFGTHSGTHADAPIHRIPGSASITDMEVTSYIGWKTAVLDFSGFTGEITGADCAKYADVLEGCDAAIFKTGWESKYGTEAFFESYPGLTAETAAFLEEKGIHLIGLETPSVHPADHEKIHVELLRRNIMIVESLSNVSKISKAIVEFHAVPLKLKGLDGSPVRAYVIE